MPGNKQRLFYSGLLSLPLCIAIIVGAYLYLPGVNTRLEALEKRTSQHSSGMTGQKIRPKADDDLAHSIADLDTRMQAMADSITVLEARLASTNIKLRAVAAIAGSIVAGTAASAPETGPIKSALTRELELTVPAAGEVESGPVVTAAATKTGGDLPEVTPARVLKTASLASEATPTVPEAGNGARVSGPGAGSMPAAVVSGDGREGAWVISLLSSPDQAAVEQFAAWARSRDIPVEENRTLVKGREYWRLQIAGFSTRGEAQSYAGEVKDKLGLKDVWIFRR